MDISKQTVSELMLLVMLFPNHQNITDIRGQK